MTTIRPYTASDYPQLADFYKKSGWFDPETDAQKRLDEQVTDEPQSILLAYDGEKLVGTVSLLFTRRHGLYFRLIADSEDVRSELLTAGEPVFKTHGYSEAHIMAPENDFEKHTEYEKDGFTKGKSYRWFWKKFT